MADASASGAGVRKGVGVQVPPRARREWMEPLALQGVPSCQSSCGSWPFTARRSSLHGRLSATRLGYASNWPRVTCGSNVTSTASSGGHGPSDRGVGVPDEVWLDPGQRHERHQPDDQEGPNGPHDLGTGEPDEHDRQRGQQVGRLDRDPHPRQDTLIAIITSNHRSPNVPLPAARPRTNATTITTASRAIPTRPKSNVGLTTALPTRPTMP